MHERMEKLIELLKRSSEVTFVIPALVFDEECDPKDNFKELREAYNWIRRNNDLEVEEILIHHNDDPMDDDLEITVKLIQSMGME